LQPENFEQNMNGSSKSTEKNANNFIFVFGQ